MKMRPSDLKVSYALMGKPLRWSELLTKAQVSKGMLSLSLNALIEEGIVLTEVLVRYQ